MTTDKRTQKKHKELYGVYEKAYKLIPNSGEGRIKLENLAHSLGVTKRDCSGIVASLVFRFDIPVCADRTITAGYYIARNEDEAIEGTRALYSQGINMLKRARAVRKANFERLRLYDNQCEKS